MGRTIFINLLSNTIKFSPNANKVIVELSSEKDHTIISVIDFGLGIPESEVEKIFMPFTRGQNVDSIQGTGLGLSIVKEALAAMGGKIIVNSTLGIGTTFVVKIPKKTIRLTIKTFNIEEMFILLSVSVLSSIFYIELSSYLRIILVC